MPPHPASPPRGRGRGASPRHRSGDPWREDESARRAPHRAESALLSRSTPASHPGNAPGEPGDGRRTMKAIERVAVLGAGVMGGGIAAHLANAGMRVLLLDVVPADAPAGDRAARNRLAAAGLENAKKNRAFYVPSYASNVEVGNLEDDVARLREGDWVIEAVLEDLEVKQKLFAEKVAPNLGADAVLSSNTSGLSVEAMASVLPPALRPRFLVIHFFNPPRHMRLVELVPCRKTSPAVLEGMTALLRKRLGKGVVRGKDTPNFVANRIGVY